MIHDKTDFIPFRFSVNFAGVKREIHIFGSMITWLRHLNKHFADPTEPWSSCFAESEMQGVKDLADRINKAGMEAFLQKFHRLCQKKAPDAVEIYGRGMLLYRKLAIRLGQSIQSGFHYPRYIVLAMVGKGHKQKGQKEVIAYVITQPLAAFAIIQSYVLKTIYFPGMEITSDEGIRLINAQEHMFIKTGEFLMKGEPITYIDRQKNITFLCTDEREDMRVFIPETCWPRYVLKSYAENG